MKANLRDVLIVSTMATLGFGALRPLAQQQENAVTMNLRSAAFGMKMYSEDADELLPLAFAPNNAGQSWRWNSYVHVPEGWENSDTSRSRKDEDAVAWANSIAPYLRSREMLSAPGLEKMRLPSASYEKPSRAWITVGFAFNGLLHSYSIAGVNDPNRVPLLWQGFGLMNLEGFALSSPALTCMLPGDCRYKANVQVRGALFSPPRPIPPNTTAYFISTGLALTQRQLNAGNTSPTSFENDPFASYPADRAGAYWQMDDYPMMFMPDMPRKD